MSGKDFVKLLCQHLWHRELTPLDAEKKDTDKARWRFAVATGIFNGLVYICIPFFMFLCKGWDESTPSLWGSFVANGFVIGFLSLVLMLSGKSMLTKVVLPTAVPLAVGGVPILLYFPYQKWPIGLALFVPLILIGMISAWIRFSPIVVASRQRLYDAADDNHKLGWVRESAAFWRTVTISLTFGSLANIIPLIYWSRGIAEVKDEKMLVFCVFYAIFYTGYFLIGPIRLSFHKAWEATDLLLPDISDDSTL